MFDTQDDSIWTDGAIAPHYKGTTVTTMRGKTESSTATEFGHGEVLDWNSTQLRCSGEAVVDLNWRFEDVK